MAASLDLLSLLCAHVPSAEIPAGIQWSFLRVVYLWVQIHLCRHFQTLYRVILEVSVQVSFCASRSGVYIMCICAQGGPVELWTPNKVFPPRHLLFCLAVVGLSLSLFSLCFRFHKEKFCAFKNACFFFNFQKQFVRNCQVEICLYIYWFLKAVNITKLLLNIAHTSDYDLQLLLKIYLLYI
jgi:hypothetical protein